MRSLQQPRSRVLAWALCLALALSFVLPSTLALAATGGYVEKELTLPEGYASFSNPAALPSGGFALAAKRADTGAWELLSFASVTGAPAVTPLDSSLGDIASIAVAPDGQVMATLSNLPGLPGLSKGGEGGGVTANTQIGGGDSPAGDQVGSAPTRIQFSPDSMQTTVVWYDQSGAVASSFTASGMLFATAALSERRVAALGMGAGVVIYDGQGKTLSTIDRNDVFGLAAVPDGLCLMQGDKVIQVDLDGNTVRTFPVSQGLNGQLAATPAGELYFVGVSGIYTLVPDAEATLVSDVARFLIGAPDSSLSSICALADGTLVAQMGGGGMSVSGGGGRASVRIGNDLTSAEDIKLMAYVMDDSVDLGSNVEFTVTALRDSTKLRKAVNEFQRAHPEVTVRLNALLAEDDDQTPVEDAIRTLNTDLLAGKGGDVMILDELPLSQYISKGVLAPLDETLAGIGILPGILEGSRAADGKLYAVPTQFRFGTLWGDRAKLEGVSTLDALLNMPLDDAQELMSARTPEDLIELFYPSCQEAFLTETGKPAFDTPEFEAFLEAMYRIYSAQISAPEQASGRVSMRPVSMDELQGMMNGALAAMPSMISSTMETALPYTAAGGENSVCVVMPGLNGAGTSYIPSLTAGINAQTSNRALSDEFLRLLFSAGIQELENGEGLPTVTASLDKLIADAKERSKSDNIMMMISTGSGNPIEMKQPGEAAWDALRAICDTLNQPCIPDRTLYGFLVEETAAFFEGQDTAHDAALALQQRASAYLNE